jgi:hypothetical protein
MNRDIDRRVVLSASQKAAQLTGIALYHVDSMWWTWFYNDFLRDHQFSTPCKMTREISGSSRGPLQNFCNSGACRTNFQDYFSQ